MSTTIDGSKTWFNINPEHVISKKYGAQDDPLMTIFAPTAGATKGEQAKMTLHNFA